ncbi:expressed unknown protein [Seminavis robusta]|uniref:Uncharacterized protein n=1 Tax=Seminavis robusta TaxID=568900 RepID=A0A9N8HBG2_9STRA|nr:expressed unknown protein [Seminavis robusta]|eukprot:Sro275_g105830.1 n/a (289) ;mRNA; r:66290-67156
MNTTSTLTTTSLPCMSLAAELNNQLVESILRGEDSNVVCCYFKSAFTALDISINDPIIANLANSGNGAVEGGASSTGTINYPAPEALPGIASLGISLNDSGGANVSNCHYDARVNKDGVAPSPPPHTGSQWIATAIPGMADTGFYIANQAVSFKLGDQGNTVCPNATGLFLLFNMAIALHSDGLKQGDNNKLDQACVFYTTCIQFLTKGSFQYRDKELVNTIALFCFNNAAQVLYRCLNSPDVAASILRSMESFMSKYRCNVSQEILSNILANAVLIPTSPLRAANAA